MATFTPPSDLTYPGYGADSLPVARRLLRYQSGNPRTRHLLLYDDDTALAEASMPPPLYHSDGSIDKYPEERVSTIFEPHQTVTVNATQQATLEAAGFHVD